LFTESKACTACLAFMDATPLNCVLSSGHIKFYETIAFRSHVQVATTATFCTFKNSFDFEPSCYIFEQTSSFDIHMQLSAQQQNVKV